MNVHVGSHPQITVAPRCPACESSDSAIRRSKGITLTHEGKRCHAQKQYRQCRECGENFGVIHIKGTLAQPRNKSGHW